MRLLMIGFTMGGKSNDCHTIGGISMMFGRIQMMESVDDFMLWISNSS